MAVTKPKEVWIVNTDTHYDVVYHVPPNDADHEYVDITRFIEYEAYQILKTDLAATDAAFNLDICHLELKLKLASEIIQKQMDNCNVSNHLLCQHCAELRAVLERL